MFYLTRYLSVTIIQPCIAKTDNVSIIYLLVLIQWHQWFSCILISWTAQYSPSRLCATSIWSWIQYNYSYYQCMWIYIYHYDDLFVVFIISVILIACSGHSIYTATNTNLGELIQDRRPLPSTVCIQHLLLLYLWRMDYTIVYHSSYTLLSQCTYTYMIETASIQYVFACCMCWTHMYFINTTMLAHVLLYIIIMFNRLRVLKLQDNSMKWM